MIALNDDETLIEKIARLEVVKEYFKVLVGLLCGREWISKSYSAFAI